jgi:spore coat protein U-like protein
MYGNPTDITIQYKLYLWMSENARASPNREQTVPRSVYLAYNTSQEGPKAQPWNNQVPAEVLKTKGASFHTLIVSRYQSVTGSANL